MMTQAGDGRIETLAPHVRCLQATIPHGAVPRPPLRIVVASPEESLPNPCPAGQHSKGVTTRTDPARGAESTVNEHGHPFHSIESSHEYVALLLQAIEETATDVGEDLRRTHSSGAARRREAFQLIAYKLEQLRSHVATSRRLLNDLRTLRRMLHGERSADRARRRGDERCA